MDDVRESFVGPEGRAAGAVPRAVVALAAVVLATGIGATGALAADLGRPAPAAVDYVKVCDAYGTGFFYIPGSETCLRIGGYVRAEYRTGDSNPTYRFQGSKTNYSGPYSWSNDRNRNAVYTRGRALLDIDARTNTEFGLLRSMIEVYWTVNTGSSSSAVNTAVDYAYVQWGGLTAGRTQTVFDFFTGFAYGAVFGYDTSARRVNLLSYTYSFGNGIGLTVALEDSSTSSSRRENGAFEGAAADSPLNGVQYGGNRYPDVVAALKIQQDWGSAQVMGQAHHVRGQAVPGVTRGKDEWGYAVGAGVIVNLPMIAPGDQVALQAAWGSGAPGTVFSPSVLFQGENVSGTLRNGTAVSGSLANLGADAVYSNRGTMHLTEAWSVYGGYKHNFSPTWQHDLNIGYADVDGFGARDYRQFEVVGDIRWKIVSGLTLGAELEYRTVDFSSKTISFYSGQGRKLRDDDAWVGMLRVQRDF
ncbi:porin [Prosthecomicrobium sp. N25]|uniref:porin n=1 Tax=Prosthecomicrobium sp. N25 TaxID=3129254 RepID=UPI0030785CA3